MRLPRLEQGRWCRTKVVAVLAAVMISVQHASFAAEPDPGQLADLSLEQLMASTITVSSVARRPGSVQRSPAAVSIVTQEDLRRSGATQIQPTGATISSHLLRFAKSVKRGNDIVAR